MLQVRPAAITRGKDDRRRGVVATTRRDPKQRPAPDLVNRTLASNGPSVAFGQRCAKVGGRPSMGTVGDAYDNGMAESCFASLECERLVDLSPRYNP